MAIFHMWWLRTKYSKWSAITITIITTLASIFRDRIIGDIIDYFLGTRDMSIIGFIQAKPFTILALLLIIATIWIWRLSSKESILGNLHHTLLTIRDANEKITSDLMPSILNREERQKIREVWLLVFQDIANREDKTSDITIEELDAIRLQRLIPRNLELESIKGQNKKWLRLWDDVKHLQTNLMDYRLDDYIAVLKRRIILHDAYDVYRQVLTSLKILNIADYAALLKSVKITRDALDEAYNKTFRYISYLRETKSIRKKVWGKRGVKENGHNL